MPKFLNRLVALTLVPCLLADPAFAALGPASIRISSVPSSIFSEQALVAKAIAATRYVLGDREEPIRKTSAQVQHLISHPSGIDPTTRLARRYQRSKSRWGRKLIGDHLIPWAESIKELGINLPVAIFEALINQEYRISDGKDARSLLMEPPNLERRLQTVIKKTAERIQEIHSQQVFLNDDPHPVTEESLADPIRWQTIQDNVQEMSKRFLAPYTPAMLKAIATLVPSASFALMFTPYYHAPNEVLFALWAFAILPIGIPMIVAGRIHSRHNAAARASKDPNQPLGIGSKTSASSANLTPIYVESVFLNLVKQALHGRQPQEPQRLIFSDEGLKIRYKAYITPISGHGAPAVSVVIEDATGTVLYAAHRVRVMYKTVRQRTYGEALETDVQDHWILYHSEGGDIRQFQRGIKYAKIFTLFKQLRRYPHKILKLETLKRTTAEQAALSAWVMTYGIADGPPTLLRAAVQAYREASAFFSDLPIDPIVDTMESELGWPGVKDLPQVLSFFDAFKQMRGFEIDEHALTALENDLAGSVVEVIEGLRAHLTSHVGSVHPAYTAANVAALLRAATGRDYPHVEGYIALREALRAYYPETHTLLRDVHRDVALATRRVRNHPANTKRNRTDLVYTLRTPKRISVAAHVPLATEIRGRLASPNALRAALIKNPFEVQDQVSNHPGYSPSAFVEQMYQATGVDLRPHVDSFVLRDSFRNSHPTLNTLAANLRKKPFLAAELKSDHSAYSPKSFEYLRRTLTKSKLPHFAEVLRLREAARRYYPTQPKLYKAFWADPIPVAYKLMEDPAYSPKILAELAYHVTGKHDPALQKRLQSWAREPYKSWWKTLSAKYATLPALRDTLRKSS